MNNKQIFLKETKNILKECQKDIANINIFIFMYNVKNEDIDILLKRLIESVNSISNYIFKIARLSRDRKREKINWDKLLELRINLTQHHYNLNEKCIMEGIL